MRKQKPGSRLAVVVAAALMTTGCVINLDAESVVVREEKRFTVGPGADLTLETWDGSIEVRSWDRNEILVEIQKRAPEREEAAALIVNATQEGNRIKVDAPQPKVSREVIGLGNFNVSVSYVVSVPRAVKLNARTRDGSITVREVTGNVTLHSGDGSIQAADIQGDLRAETGDGSLNVRDVKGRVSVESGDGSIHVDGRFDDLQAETRDGSIVIEAVEGTAMKNDWTIATGDGSVQFRVPGSFNAEIDAESGDGRVSSNIDGLQRDRNDDDDRESLKGRVGSGGHVVKLRSGDGSIRVTR